MKMPNSNPIGNGYYGYGDRSNRSDGNSGQNSAGGSRIQAQNPMPRETIDFSEYMWMENEEEYEKEVMQQLEEEALMEECMEAIRKDEEAEARARTQMHHIKLTADGVWSTGNDADEVVGMMSDLKVHSRDVAKSTLNPEAQEFVPIADGPSTSSNIRRNNS